MQIFVLGMHRSGTSILTRVLNLMGAYLGPEGCLMPPDNKQNPKGFWERNDVVALHDVVLKKLECFWYRISRFDLESIEEETREFFEEQARPIYYGLEAHRPWAIKDPRLCLLFPLWKNFLEIPVCVFISRNPLDVAASLKNRDNFPTAFSLALWEKYTISALKACEDIPTIFVSFEDLVDSPYETVRQLYKELLAINVANLRIPSDKEVSVFLNADLVHHSSKRNVRIPILTQQQQALWNALRRKDPLSKNSKLMTISNSCRELLELYENFEDKRNMLQFREVELKHISENLAQMQQSIDQRDKALTERDEALAQMGHAVTEKDQALAQMRQEADELRSERDRIWDQLDEIKGQLEGVRLELETVQHTADAQAVSLNDLRQERDTIMNSLTWRSARFFLDRVGRRIPGFDLFTGIAKRLDRWRQERKEIRLIKKSGFFDKDYYLRANPDVAQAKIDPIRHYIRHGWKEGRNPSRKFETGFYLASNPDVAASGMNPLVHYALQGQGEGRQRKSQFDICDYEVQFNSVEDQTNYGLPVGVFIHLYYEELAEEIAGYIRNISYPLHVYISTTDEEKKHSIEQAFSAKGVKDTLVCKVFPNRGWDVAPFVVGFADEIRKYDICLRLHGKKSTHNTEEFGTQWRTYLLNELVGGPKRVKRIINNFVSRADLGIIMPRHWKAVRNWIKIGENYEKMESLLARINIPLYPHQEINYPSGSMFWFRSKALSPLLDLNLQWDDFDQSGAGGRDGTLAHAIERSILYIAASKGCKWSVIEEEQKLNVSPTEKSMVQIGNVYQAYQRPEENPFYEAKETPQVLSTDIKLIAFYLPQFHPFEENERFWGKGFTEWTNTTKALPLFKGQYQPRLPGELGFYDTRLKDVIKRQIELAKQYGIYGFCLHHYWFDGKPVMRVPYNHIMKNKDLDIPFCLHWANEPWTARFDGLSQKGGVLLAQKHSADDDIAFFHDIEPALNDERYIRIEGRPLLIIYRPSLFPDIRSSVERWRKCCNKAGLGDLYLAVIQTSFERPVDPRKYGFDAAIEFPPHNVRAVSAKSKVELFATQFDGNIYSYPEMVKGALNRSVPRYTLFRGVLPDWDCTPRRKNPDVFIGSSPAMYQRWLEGICSYTKKNLPAGKRFIFLNAWNEWAEGAYLEPDRRYGYAYLNATSRASAVTHGVEHTLTEPIKKVAVVAHIYYTDLLEEFVRYFKNIPCKFDLYVSTTQDKEEDIRLKLQEHILREHLVVTGVENKGMDIGPFVVEFGKKYHEYDLVCKVHSKKSTYNPEYAGWRGYLLDNLLGSKQTVEDVLSRFEKNPHLGLLFPEPFPPVADKLEWGSNRETATKLLKKMGIHLSKDKHLVFPAGSMFWFRPKALSPLFDLALTLDAFENGTSHVVDQRTGDVIDGTLAHAVERTFVLVTENRNYEWETVLYVPYDQEKGRTTLESGKKRLRDHFKKKSRYKKTAPGYCPVCQKKTTFKSKHRWLRDHYRCDNCRSIPRERAIFHVMDIYFPGWEKKRLHEIAPANDHFARRSENYSCSQYYPDEKTGLIINGIRNENIERLTFADSSLDFIVCLDVHEHIFDPGSALKEMVRVVRVGGSAVFTVPIHKDLAEGRQRAKMNSNGQIQHFFPADYHGNPVGDGRSLVTWDYGRDFEDRMHVWLEGIKVDIEIINETKEQFGIEGEFLDVIIISK